MSKSQGLTSHPAFMMGVLGAGAIVIFSVVIGFSEGATGDAVGTGPDVEVVSGMAEGGTGNAPSDMAVEELSGTAVTPDDTADLVTPVADDEAAAMPEQETRLAGADDLVIDPDGGMKSGQDPAGSGAFYATPSGPEGRDGDAFSTE